MKREIGIFKEADLSQLARDLIDSYHYETDFLSELLQNAVDAIRRTGRSKGNLIEVEFNAPEGRFTICDNGTGMSTDDLVLFAMGRTDKTTSSFFQIGEKGVGGSYVLMISDYFSVESVKDGNRVLAECVDARKRVYNNQEPVLKVILEEACQGTKSYTRIDARSSEFKSYKDLEELTLDLRLFTALGNTRVPFDKEDMAVDIQVTFVTQDEDGMETSKKTYIDFCFFHPAREYADEVIWFAELEKQGVAAKGGGFAVPEGSYKDMLLGIRDDDLGIIAVLGNEAKLEEREILPTIFLGVRGAPMPVEIKPPATGYAGYWRNLFVLINSDDVKLDAGRKSIGRADKMEINERLRTFFNKYVPKYAKLFFDPKYSPLAGALEQLKEQARSKEELYIPQIPFSKVPSRGEELAVVAIFHELIGARVLKGYRTISASSDARYDAIIHYSVPITSLGVKARQAIKETFRKMREKPDDYSQIGFIEFKVDAVEFMSDCDKGKKDPKEVMLLVAYDLSRGKIRKNWAVEPIADDERVFMGSSFKLVYKPAAVEVPLILLKEFRHAKSVKSADGQE